MKKFLLPLVSVIALAGCSSDSQANLMLRGPGGEAVQLTAEIADEPEERSRGLMYRQELAENEGMVFLFDKPAPLVFWMKNTLIPLDIVFFDAQGRYLSSDTMVPCESDPCPLYRSGGDAAYVLEVATGFLQKHALREGWWLDMNSLPASLIPVQ